MAATQRATVPALGHGIGSTQVTRALATCATEADVVQVLYALLSPVFGYDVVNLQVLERAGWCHRTVVDQGVLQDPGRFPLAESYFASHYEAGRTVAGHPTYDTFQPSRGSPSNPRLAR